MTRSPHHNDQLHRGPAGRAWHVIKMSDARSVGATTPGVWAVPSRTVLPARAPGRRNAETIMPELGVIVACEWLSRARRGKPQRLELIMEESIKALRAATTCRQSGDTVTARMWLDLSRWLLWDRTGGEYGAVIIRGGQRALYTGA